MHDNPYKLSTCVFPLMHCKNWLMLKVANSFLVQIVCLTTAPAFYSAGIYLCLARMQVLPPSHPQLPNKSHSAIAYGDGLSRIKPIWYTRFFLNCDIISLSLHGAGGGIASAATTKSTMDLGNHLMLAGLIFQIVSLLLFGIACTDFAMRVQRYGSWKNPAYKKLRASTRFRGFLWALLVSFMTIFTRCVYRVIELGGGWNNRLMREQTPFIILESW